MKSSCSKPSNGLDSKPEVLREMSPEVECGDEVDDTENEGVVGRSSARSEGETKRLAVGGSGGRREEVTAVALVGNSRRERWRNRA